MNIDRTVHAINMEETFRRRLVHGRDLNDWHTQLDAWRETGDTASALALLYDIMDAVETIEQYDPREPQPYWYEMAATILHGMGRHEEEGQVLRRWLVNWQTRDHGSKQALEARALAAASHAPTLF